MATRVSIYHGYDAAIKADDYRSLIYTTITSAGYDAEEFRIWEGSNYAKIRAYAPDILIFDLPLSPDTKAWNVLEICLLDPDISQRQIIVLSASLIDAALRQHFEEIGCRVLAKPFRPKDLTDLLAYVDKIPRPASPPRTAQQGASQPSS